MDPKTLADLGGSRGATPIGGGMGGFGGGVGGNPFAPFFGGGAVGYEPQITILPEGANMMVTAVISADRRYVRISCGPFFSGIGQVNTFNYSSGASGTSNSGGTGGQGFGGLFGGSSGGAGGGLGGICFGGLFADINTRPDVGFPYRGRQGAVVVVYARPGYPGANAGFRAGDVIYRFDGQPLPVNDPMNALRDKVIPLKLEGGYTRTVGILRNGVPMELKVTWPRQVPVRTSVGEIRDLPDRSTQPLG
jgi:hypothetical protein